RTLGFADQDAGKNPTGTQNFAALSRKTRIGRSDLRAARGGAGENGAELTGDGNQRIDLKNDVLSSVFPATRPSQSSCNHERGTPRRPLPESHGQVRVPISVVLVTVAYRPALGASRGRAGPCLRSHR